jgi:hypothetical protein
MIDTPLRYLPQPNQRASGIIGLTIHVANSAYLTGWPDSQKGPSSEESCQKRQFVTTITEPLGCRIYDLQHRTEEDPVLTRTFRQTRELTGDWRRRPRSRCDLAMIGEVDRRTLGHTGNFAAHEDDHHRSMFANLAAAAWVWTLMTSAYYVFSTLLTVS